jgi:hypothetical protein
MKARHVMTLTMSLAELSDMIGHPIARLVELKMLKNEANETEIAMVIETEIGRIIPSKAIEPKAGVTK